MYVYNLPVYTCIYVDICIYTHVYVKCMRVCVRVYVCVCVYMCAGHTYTRDKVRFRSFVSFVSSITYRLPFSFGNEIILSVQLRGTLIVRHIYRSVVSYTQDFFVYKFYEKLMIPRRSNYFLEY